MSEEWTLADESLPISQDYLEFIDAYCKDDQECETCKVKDQCGPLFAEAVCETMIPFVRMGVTNKMRKS
jgi:hypothetical protein